MNAQQQPDPVWADGTAPGAAAESGPGDDSAGAAASPIRPGRPTEQGITRAEDRPARLDVGIVGAGRVGPALGAALRLAGHRPVAASGVSEASRARAAALLPGVPLVEPAEVLARSELVLLTVPDDALPGLVDGLARTGAIRAGQLLVHTSGRHGTAVLQPALRAGALPLALHPVMTFSGSSVDVQRLAGCSFGVTAPEELRLAAQALVIEMGGEPEWIAEEARPLYHAALALGSNHLVTLVAQAMELLRTAGVTAPDRMLGPLLSAALDNSLRSGDAALTGPVARGDADTVAAHVAELRAHAPQAVAGYLAMARTTADRAMTHGRLQPAQAEALLGVLSEPGDAYSPQRTSSSEQSVGTDQPETTGRPDDPSAQVPGAQASAPTSPRPVPLAATAAELPALPDTGERAVVMTMGALHDGHAALIREAREHAGAHGQVVVTVFVNPLQFGPGEDLERYPRTLDADLRLAAEAGADLVFAPAAEEVYPGGEPQVRIAAGPMGERYEGQHRPGHFDGMLTVVAKLLHLTRPTVAFYGQKDAQQLALIRRMVRDLNFPVRIAGVPTVREPDGLALSSRNRYLEPAERDSARVLSRALFAAERVAGRGPEAARQAAWAVLDEAAGTEPAVRTDYLALLDPADFTPLGPDFVGEAVLAVAARVGTTRLIDNISLRFTEAGAAK